MVAGIGPTPVREPEMFVRGVNFPERRTQTSIAHLLVPKLRLGMPLSAQLRRSVKVTLSAR